MREMNELFQLKALDTSKVELYLASELRATHRDIKNAAFAVAYVIVKSSDRNDADMSTLDSFLATCEVSEEIRLFLTDMLTGFWDQVAKSKGMFDVDMYKAFLLFNDRSDPRNGDDPTPNSISQLAARLLDIHEGDSVADFYTGRASFIRECFLTHPDAEYIGYDISTYAAVIASMRAEILGDNVRIALQNINSMDISERRYDRIFIHGPFGVRVSSNDNSTALQYLNKNISATKRTCTLDWLSNVAAISTLNPEGRAVSVTPTGVLFRSDEREIRKYFVDNGFINAIIALPAYIFEATSIPTVLFVFSFHNDSIRFIDARQLYLKGRRFNTLTEENIDEIFSLYSNDGPLSKMVSKEAIIANDYNLDLNRFFEPELVIPDGVPFGSVIRSVTRGAQLKASQLDALSSEEPTPYQYLTLSDIQDGQIQDQLSYIATLDDSLAKYCIKNNDLIVSKSGAPVKTAIAVVPEDEAILATGNLYVIELDESKVNPWFVKAFFDSELGQVSLQSICTGSSLPIITVEALTKMLIPLPSLEEQETIANQYLAAIDEIKLLKHKITKVQERVKHIYDESGVN